ncbi:MAG: 6-phosphofructokinase [Chryseolinea sp.]
MPKKLLILTGGGDCPGLNAVIRGVAKRARIEKDWTVYGSIEAFNGILKEPKHIVEITNNVAAGIHVTRRNHSEDDQQRQSRSNSLFARPMEP